MQRHHLRALSFRNHQPKAPTTATCSTPLNKRKDSFKHFLGQLVIIVITKYQANCKQHHRSTGNWV